MPQAATKKKPTGNKGKSVTPLKRSFSIEIWPLHEIKPYEKNARKISEKAIQKVAASLKEFGWRQPMVVDKEGVLIVGHTRRLAAVHLGWTEGPVHIATDLTPSQIRAYRLMDNRSNDEAIWDMDLVKLEVGELADLDVDISLTGFDLSELKGLYPSGEETAPDTSPALGGLQYRVVVECRSESHQAEVLQDLEDQGLTCKALIS